MYTNSGQLHLISSCLQLCAASSIKYSMVLSSRYWDASVVTVIDVTLYVIHAIFNPLKGRGVKWLHTVIPV